MIKKLNYLFLLSGFLSAAQFYEIPKEKPNGNVKSTDLMQISYRNTERPMLLQTFDTKGRLVSEKEYSEHFLRKEIRNEYLPNKIISTICESCGDHFDSYFSRFSIKENEKYPYHGYGTNDHSVRKKVFKTTDSKGNVVTEKFYDTEGYLTSMNKLTYNTASKLLSNEKYNSENELSGYDRYKYSNNKLITEKISKSRDEAEEKTNYSYNTSDKKTAEKEVSKCGISEKSFVYSNTKDSIKTLTYAIKNGKNKKLVLKEISYSKGGKQITELQNIENDEVARTTIFEYDINKNLISKKAYFKDVLRYEEQYSYDKNKNWISLDYSYLVNASENGSPLKTVWQTEKYFRKIVYY
ncbi:hypothetical protein ASG31_15370 [Chryseobacterium sp. Leaf404]|uniref:hypothetical protein n=1 Tax=unclassified Chryseobacterium TaxID=2593645 RepID=UPI0006F87986|nr:MULTISPECIES: hypothetical protein [unclassified Chryseobacterium]KQT15305.1 hypothetical protein ASG31_15370 [Chryseobacterium sp. Leaf404]